MTMRRSNLKTLLVSALTLGALTNIPPAMAWTRQGHMVTAAIAFEEIKARGGDKAIEELGRLLEAHPDKGPFDVAADRATGEARVFRMFLECARWPDDVRETPQDRPAWHGEFRGISADRTVAQTYKPYGAIRLVYEMNDRILSDPRIPASERGQALCWVAHLAGDAHQPLHAAQLVSDAFPRGDFGGSLSHVIDPVSGETVSFHWFWDDLIHRDGSLDLVRKRAVELVSAHPRAALMPAGSESADIGAWLDESFELARTVTYQDGYPGGGTASAPVTVSDAYFAEARAVAEMRGTQAGYRLADVILVAIGE